MAQLVFVEYHLPRGSKSTRYIESNDEIRFMFDYVCHRGYAFEFEIIRTGEVSMTVLGTDPCTGEICDLDCVVCANDKTEIEKNAALMVDRFYNMLRMTK